MSLHTLAKHVQGKGRNNDKMLVHMTPSEVQGLQALAKASGGSLTINPETGLAEAGFLEQILPIAAAAAATYFTAGAAAPALSAALGSTMAGGIAAGTLAGAGVGAVSSGIQGKDVGQGALYGGLGGAISGGMGAYGGGDAVTGSAGEVAQTAKAVDIANQGTSGQAMLNQTLAQSGGAPGAALTPVQQATLDPFAGLAGTTPGMPPASPVNPGFTPIRPDAAAQGITGVGPDLTSGTAASSAPPVSPSSAANAARIVNSPPTYYSNLGSGFGDTLKKAGIQALPGIGADIGMNTPEGPPGPEEYVSAATLSPDFRGSTPKRPDPYRPQYTRYAAGGGLMSLAGGGGPLEHLNKNAMGGQGNMFPQSQQPVTAFADPIQTPVSSEVLNSGFDTKTNPYTGAITMSGGGDTKKKKQRASLTADRTMAGMRADQAGIAMLNNARYGANMTGASPMSSMSLGDLPNPVGAARGGLADLGGYSDGGRLLKGPGDGMSDNIPAQIGRRQPARLADGEFVVPADVVSHLGNGSTDAGAKRLYAMMAKVRQARTGKKKQAPAVNMNKFLPV